MKNVFSTMVMFIRLFLANPYQKSKIYGHYKKISFGKNVRILHYPRWGSEPFLIEIGNNVTITRGVAFVTHDGSVALFRDEFPGLNVYGKIQIGNNVFIGINSIILPNVKIGNNVIIGAGSVVNRNITDDVVVAGVPARILGSVDDYKKKILEKGIQISYKNEKERIQLIKKHLT